MVANEVTAPNVASLDTAMQNLSVDPAQNQCHLLRIPGEMRNKIYEYALTPSDEAIINIDLYAAVLSHNPLLTLKDEFRKVSALPVTCKKIQKETQELLYSMNSLRICAPIQHSQVPLLDSDPEMPSMISRLKLLSEQSWIDNPWREKMVLSLGCISSDDYLVPHRQWYKAARILRDVRSLLPHIDIEAEIKCPLTHGSLGMYRFGLGLKSLEALKADFKKRARMADGTEGPLTEEEISLAESTILALRGLFQ